MENLYEQSIMQFPEGILIVNSEDTITFANQLFLTNGGYEDNDIVGKKLSIVAKRLSGEHDGEVFITKKNGEVQSFWYVTQPIIDEDGGTTHQLLVFSHFQKTGLDPLTKLPNRFLLQQKLQEILKVAQKNDESFTVLFLDLDRFKFVNDTLGHSYGDLLLQQASQRLKKIMKDNVVARMGGDEFVCILQERNNAGNGTSVAKQILLELAKPFYLNDIEIHISTSIGMSVYPFDGDDAELLITSADSAMYRAKKNGRNQLAYAKPEGNAEAFERFNIENHLRKALENKEFNLHFQPQLNIKMDKIVGFEALLRWENPELGMISPGEFIPIAEDTGLIIPIGDWVLETACRKIKEWEKQGFHSLTIAVNISAKQFLQRNMVEKVKAIIEKTQINPSFLELEITEGVVIHDVDYAITILENLRDLGVKISIDDFGTGYSSLNYLKKLPVNSLKIDRSFIFDIDTNTSSKALTQAITTLAHDLQLHVIAEGVETYKQLSHVKKTSCDVIQGFYFSKPLPSDKVLFFLQNTKEKVMLNA